MSEQEFQRALVIVLIAGTLVIGAGAVALVMIFRGFRGSKPRMGLMAGLIIFVFLACAVLFALSFER